MTNDERLIAIKEACAKARNVDEEVLELSKEFYADPSMKNQWDSIGIIAEVYSDGFYRKTKARIDKANPDKMQDRTVKEITDFEKKIAGHLTKWFNLPKYLVAEIIWEGKSYTRHTVVISLLNSEVETLFKDVRQIEEEPVVKKKEIQVDSVKEMRALQDVIPERLLEVVGKTAP